MRRSVRLWLVVAIGVGLSGLAAGAEPPCPNFVFINIDDLGYADIGPFGSKLNRTPNLDRMAREGWILASSYAASVCPPSRAALMTGCYPKRSLPVPHVLFPANPSQFVSGRGDDCGGAQGGRVHDRLHRQTASGRPARVPADAAGI